MTKDKKTKGPTEITKPPEPRGDILEDINSYLKKFIYMHSLDRKLNSIFLAIASYGTGLIMQFIFCYTQQKNVAVRVA